jgi:hypothetical protein
VSRWAVTGETRSSRASFAATAGSRGANTHLFSTTFYSSGFGCGGQTSSPAGIGSLIFIGRRQVSLPFPLQVLQFIFRVPAQVEQAFCPLPSHALQVLPPFLPSPLQVPQRSVPSLRLVHFTLPPPPHGPLHVTACRP